MFESVADEDKISAVMLIIYGPRKGHEGWSIKCVASFLSLENHEIPYAALHAEGLFTCIAHDSEWALITVFLATVTVL
jgi:hypothetical protein